jgi:hypothetical protein
MAERSSKTLRSSPNRARSGWLALRPAVRFSWDRPIPARLGSALQPELRALVVSSHLGLEGEVLGKPQQPTLLVATSVQLEHSIALAMWAAVVSGHRHVVRYLLEQASRR